MDFQNVPWSEYLSYDTVSGHFTWIKSPARKIVLGSVAGHVNKKGYVYIKLLGTSILAHRLAWFFLTGTWPEVIDHKDRNPSNNAMLNLRDVTQQVNCHNKNAAGVSKHHNKWRAKICIDYKQVHLGLFPTEEAAREAYNKAKEEYFVGQNL